MEILALLIHLPSDRTSTCLGGRPLSALTPRNTLSRTPIGSCNGNTCAAHSPSLRSNFHMPWRAALISANAPQHSIEDTDSHIFTSATAQVLHHRNSEPGTVPQIARAVEARAEENRKPKK